MRNIEVHWRRLVLNGGVAIACVCLLGLGGPAMAQVPEDAEAEEPPSSFEEEITVTGTLIPRPTLEALSPVATLEPETIQASGITRLEDLLISLPQVFSAQNSTIANGATGTATVDLRDLGSVRTLVLVDGHRLPPGDRYAITPDLNFIPAFLVERVDILTGGASSVYGADAVAGVVNFVLDTDFEGFKSGFNYSIFQHDNNNDLAQSMSEARGFDVPTGSVWDGNQYSAHLAYGSNFADDKGHAMAYVEYREVSALLKARRDYTNCPNAMGDDGPFCGGSSTNPYGRFLSYDPAGNFVGDWTLDEGAGTTLIPFAGSGHLFNYGAVNFLQRPDERWTAGAFVDYEWNEHAKGYLNVMLMDNVSDAQIAPSGNFGNTAFVNCDNPLLSPDQYDKLCAQPGYGPTDDATVIILRRNVEGGSRNNHLEHTAFRVLGGIQGDINDQWSYDAYGLHAQVRSPQSYQNDLNAENIQDALFVIEDPVSGDPVCRSGNPGCVPWNIFQNGGVTPEALEYISLPLVLNSGLTTRVLSARLNGDLEDYGFMLPSASEGIRMAFGAEYREEELFFDPDYAYRANIATGQGGPLNPVSGSYNVTEAFTEALIPLVQDMPGARDLSLELGYRYSDYSTTGGANTWKAQASYAPVAGLKFRLGTSRATRSPNVAELFVPQSIQLEGTIDPCAGDNPEYTLEQCMRTGVTEQQYGQIPPNPAGQYNSLLGGNPNLDQEEADTEYLGVVITPQGISGFTAALDYFNVEIDGTIGNLYADDVLRQCAVTGDPALCSLIQRGVAGDLWLPESVGGGYTIATNQNIGSRTVEGIDVNASYVTPVGDAFLNFNLIGTYLMAQEIDTGLYQYDCEGLFGNTCGIPNPTWRHRFQVAYETGKLGMTLGWRMQGAVDNDISSDNPALAGSADLRELYRTNDTLEYDAYHYLDLTGAWQITDGVRWILGVNNIFDKEPPLAPDQQDADYGPGFYGFYDPWGRMVHSSLQFQF